MYTFLYTKLNRIHFCIHSMARIHFCIHKMECIQDCIHEIKTIPLNRSMIKNKHKYTY